MPRQRAQRLVHARRVEVLGIPIVAKPIEALLVLGILWILQSREQVFTARRSDAVLRRVGTSAGDAADLRFADVTGTIRSTTMSCRQLSPKSHS